MNEPYVRTSEELDYQAYVRTSEELDYQAYVRTSEELDYQASYEAKEKARHTCVQLRVSGEPVLELFGDGRVLYRGRLLVTDAELVKALYEIVGR